MKKALLILIVIASAGFGVWYFKPKESSDLITDSVKKEILSSLKTSWTEGKKSIENHLLTEGLSSSDRAYLLSMKGLAELQLREYDDSQISLNQALKLNLESENFQAAGQNSLDLADFYLSRKDYEGHENSIKKAIEYFEKAGSAKDLLDARMALANYFHMKYSNQQAINEYMLIIEQAKNINDKTGEMLAVNNLARVFQSQGDIDEALKYAEQGLKLNEMLENSNYINSSKLFLNQLYQQQNKIDRALITLQDSLNDKLESEPLTDHLNQILEYVYLLTVSMNLDRAEGLLSPLNDYVEKQDLRQGKALITFYQGLVWMYKDDWGPAAKQFSKAFELYSQTSFYEKKPLLVAYLSLSNQLSGEGLDIQEPAEQVYKRSLKNSREKLVAALSLAHFHRSQGDQESTLQWLQKAEDASRENWYWDNLALLKFKQLILDTEQKAALAKKIESAEQEIEARESAPAFDEKVYLKVLNQLNQELEK